MNDFKNEEGQEELILKARKRRFIPWGRIVCEHCDSDNKGEHLCRNCGDIIDGKKMCRKQAGLCEYCLDEIKVDK